MKVFRSPRLAAVVIAMLACAPALADEQFIGLPSYRAGAYAAEGSGLFGGWIDYMTLINERDGGVGGVKLAWTECETGYSNQRGLDCYEKLKSMGAHGNSVFQPISTGIAYSVLDKVAHDRIPLVTIGYGRSDSADGEVFEWVFPLIATYWSQASAMVKYIASREGGDLTGKKLALLYHDSAYGREPHAILDLLASANGFELVKIPVAHPGTEQQPQWREIKQLAPDWVILWSYGEMTPAALKSAAKAGYPRDHMLGVWWSGSEEDTRPAGEAAKGFTAAAFNAAGADFPVIKAIRKRVYDHDKGNLADKARIGSVYYNRGVVHGIITVEAIRSAQQHFGAGKALSGEQVRWGFEHLNIDEGRLAELGATGFMPTLKTGCADHEGSGKVRFQTWDGGRWKPATDWIDPDRKLVRGMVEESAGAYAREKGIMPRDCSRQP